jgi:glycosyltransferase involved in cell wall biosynthesis
MRPKPLLNLLGSVKKQTLYPSEILVIDGSTNEETHEALKLKLFDNLIYYKVEENDRGLTRQRNFGIHVVDKTSEVICFLDDDIILKI